MDRWRSTLQRWVGAGFITAADAERIRAFEAQQAGPQRFQWPVIVALMLGGIAIGAGVLLFVAAHWDYLAPNTRFALVLLMVAVFHAGGAFAGTDSETFRSTFHALGTAALGAAIFLTAQIFNLSANWPTRVLLWAGGAWIGFAILRDTPQAVLAAVLTPAWMAAQYADATGYSRSEGRIIADGLLLTALAYFTAVTPQRHDATRRALVWMGGIALLPCVLYVLPFGRQSTAPDAVSWSIGLLLPLGLAVLLRGREAWKNALAVIWVLMLDLLAHAYFTFSNSFIYLWCAVGSIALVAWGWDEGHSERINFGVAGFALTIVSFYVSNVMDKLGRSASLISLGVLLLAGGWLLERMRRRLVAAL